MNHFEADNNAELEEETTGIRSTCSELVTDIYKDVYLREIAKIEFQPSDGDDVLTSADWDRVWQASERARVVAIIRLDQYQERIAEQQECD